MPARRAVAATLILGLLSIALVGADAPKEAAEKTTDAYLLADRLQQQVTIQNEIPETPLAEVLEFLNDKYDLNLHVDPEFNGEDGVAVQNAEPRFVRFAAENPVLQKRVTIRKMKSVRLETVLNLVCSQIHGSYLIYSDQILLVGNRSLHGIISQGEEEPVAVTLPLVTMKIEAKPLSQVFDELSERTNRTIVLAPQVAEAAKAKVSAKFLNTPVDRVISMLAEMGELGVVRNGNAYLVTSVSKAKDLGALQSLAVLRRFGAPDANDEAAKRIDELTQRIAELEKKLGEKK
jgi:hypothetical protein